MKTKAFLYPLILLALATSCKKKDTKTDDPASGASVPTVSTTSYTLIGSKTAMSGASISSDGGAQITSKGVCWSSTNQNPTTTDSNYDLGSGTASFSVNIVNLTAGTTYYARAFATNAAGTGYGNTVTFTTVLVTDANGYTYHAVVIGSQVWMVENLRATKFNDGTPIPLVTNYTAWSNLTTPGYCWYFSDESLGASHGALYNWFAVETGKLAPKGWHVPTDAEWTALTTYLGGEGTAGDKLKEPSIYYWRNIINANNASGFTARGCGRRSYDGKYDFEGTYGFWWTATERDLFYAWSREMASFESRVTAPMLGKENGLSVRCLKN